MATRAIAIEDAKTGEVTHAVYEHSFVVRLCHWVNAVALFVMIGSGLQIFRAFPSFGAKIPQKDLLNWPKAFALGGWLYGALCPVYGRWCATTSFLAPSRRPRKPITRYRSTHTPRRLDWAHCRY